MANIQLTMDGYSTIALGDLTVHNCEIGIWLESKSDGLDDL